jgi:hypothetical protein
MMSSDFPPLNVPANPLALIFGACVMGLVKLVESAFDLEERAHLDPEEADAEQTIADGSPTPTDRDAG